MQAPCPLEKDAFVRLICHKHVSKQINLPGHYPTPCNTMSLQDHYFMIESRGYSLPELHITISYTFARTF